MSASSTRPDMTRHLKLIPYDEATGRILGTFAHTRLPREDVPVEKTLGRICAETVTSKHDIPDKNISAMDGYAISSEETKKASPSNPIHFRVRGFIHSGSIPSTPKVVRLHTFYVATGFSVPVGADAIVRAEEVRQGADHVVVTREIAKWKNVCLRGGDVKSGQVILKEGDIINAASIALTISAGRKRMSVFKIPTVGIISIGNELRRLTDNEDGRIVNNYSNLIAGYLSQMGAEPVMLGISRDNPDEIRDSIERDLARLDMVITIGGTSVGVTDHTPEGVGSGENSNIIFHGVRIVPIRPVGVAELRKKPVIMLPGHSVSAALAFFLIVVPILNVISGLPFHARVCEVRATVTKEFENDRAIDALFLLRLSSLTGKYLATPLDWGSNLMLSLAAANAFVHLKPRDRISEGQEVTAVLLGGPEISRIRIA